MYLYFPNYYYKYNKSAYRKATSANKTKKSVIPRVYIWHHGYTRRYDFPAKIAMFISIVKRAQCIVINTIMAVNKVFCIITVDIMGLKKTIDKKIIVNIYGI